MGGYGYFAKHQNSLAAGIFCFVVSYDCLFDFRFPIWFVGGSAMLFSTRHWQEKRQHYAIQQCGIALLLTGSYLSIIS